MTPAFNGIKASIVCRVAWRIASPISSKDEATVEGRYSVEEVLLISQPFVDDGGLEITLLVAVKCFLAVVGDVHGVQEPEHLGQQVSGEQDASRQ